MKLCVRAAAGQVRLCATLVGTVVGAGFISGAELVRFFPAEGFLPCLAVAALLFALCFFALFRLGAAYGGYAGMLRAMFGRAAPAVRAFVSVCSLVLCASMFAGLDAALGEGFGVHTALPVASVAAMPLLYFLSRRGVRGLYLINLLLVPAILLFLCVCVPALGETDPTACPASPAAALVCTLLYVCMNAFLAAPVVCDAGAKGGSGGGCLLAGAVIAFCAAIVLACVTREGAGALGAQMPFLYAVGKTAAFGKAFAAVSICGILTTLFSSYYPLYSAAEGKKRAALRRALLLELALALSLFGLRGIVRWLYPIMGTAGVCFFAVLCLRQARSLFGESAFQQCDQRVHGTRECAKDDGRRHHKV